MTRAHCHLITCLSLKQSGQGRIVEATIGDFMALSGSSPLNVVVQNTGRITAAFSVSSRQQKNRRGGGGGREEIRPFLLYLQRWMLASALMGSFVCQKGP